MIQAALAAGASALDEWEAKGLFAAYGIAVPAGELVKSSEAEAGGSAYRGPPGHEGRGRRDPPQDRGRARSPGRRGRRGGGGDLPPSGGTGGWSLEGVLVEQMIAGNREFMVGMKRDPLFGPVVVFGLGGVLTEALGDIALAVAPLTTGCRRTARPHQGQTAAWAPSEAIRRWTALLWRR